MSVFNSKYPLISVYKTSLDLYKKQEVDNKKRRMKMDLSSAKIVSKNNFTYDRKTKTWIQSGRNSKLIMEVSSEPISYKRNDTIKTHKYPIIFLFEDIEQGSNTLFKWRDGSQKKFISKIPTKSSFYIANTNIRNGVQVQFLMDLEFVLKTQNLLFGVCRANRKPVIRNPKNLVFFTKHDLYVVEKIILPLLNNKQLINKVKSVKKK